MASPRDLGEHLYCRSEGQRRWGKDSGTRGPAGQPLHQAPCPRSPAGLRSPGCLRARSEARPRRCGGPAGKPLPFARFPPTYPPSLPSRGTFCGARRRRCTPASCVASGMSSRNVYSGGRVGSGKLVLLKGSVSSSSCTRHTSVAMAHPSTAAAGARAEGPAPPSHRHRGAARRRLQAALVPSQPQPQQPGWLAGRQPLGSRASASRLTAAEPRRGGP